MAQSVRHVGYLFRCGNCDRRAFRPPHGALVEEVALLRRKARCAECQATGTIEVLWDSRWSEDFVDGIQELIAKTNSRSKRCSEGRSKRQ